MYKIETLIPHRHPFLFVTALEKVSLEEIIAKACFPQDWDVFKGHFPQKSIVPGVILLETMAQAGGAGLNALQKMNLKDEEDNTSASLFFLASIEEAKFRAPVYPDQNIFIHVHTIKNSSKIIKQKGYVKFNDKISCQATWLLIRA